MGDITKIPEMGDRALGESEEVMRMSAEDILAQLPPEQSFVNVERVRINGERLYLGRVTDDMFADKGVIEAIRERWGGGKYVLDIFAVPESMRDAPPEKRRPKRFCQRTIHIEGVPSDPLSSAAAMSPAAAAVPAPAGDAALVAVLREMAEDRRVLLEAIRELRVPPPAASQTGILELVTALKTLHSISPEPPAAPAPADPMSSVRSVLELARELAGLPTPEGGEREDRGGLLDRVIDKLAPVLERMVSSPPAITHQPLGAPVSRPQPQAAPTAPAHPAAPYIKTLLDSAASGDQPYIWTGMIITKVPEAMLNQFLVNPVESLAPIDPRARQYAQWLNELAADIREEISGDNEPQPAADRPA